MKIVILISGRGSNMEALIEACADPAFPAKIALVIANRPEAGGLAKAAARHIPTIVIDHTTFADREAFEAAIDAAARKARAELICLAGFMRLLNPYLVGRWRGRMINIHPSLLPAFRGLHVHERVLESGVRFSGCTVHFVSPEMDEGPIIAQAAVPVLPDDTPDDLAARVLEQEHRIYPLAVRLIAERRVRITGHRVELKDTPMASEALINPAAPMPGDP